MGYPKRTKNRDITLGRAIYVRALDDRRGFRYDQIGIHDKDIWLEIFEHMGRVAREELGKEPTDEAAEA